MSTVWASLRALLAIVLLAGLVVLIGGLGLGVLGLLGLFLLAARDGQADLAIRGVVVAAAAVPLLLSMVQGLGAITRSAPPRTDALPVTREEAPGLWELATGIAWRAGARPPDVLLLTGDANASVSEDGAALGLLSGQRRLHLGLPLLASLTHAELRAVLAHEFGHFSHRHTRFGAVAYRCDVALATTLGEWDSGRRWWFSLPHLVVRGSVRLYALVFRRLTFAVRRHQELEADRTAARLAGSEVTASALRATHGTASAWRRFQREWLDPAALVGMHPDNPYLAFRSLLGELGVRRVPVEEDRTRPGRRDSHPPLGLRLRRLAELDVPPGEDDGAGALRLLPEDVGRVVEELRGPSAHSLTTVPWERWTELSANRVAGTRAWGLLRAASRATGERLPGLDTVLRVLAEDGTEPLAREFGGTREELAEALHGLVGHTLLREGRASWVPLWGGGTRLVCEGLADDGLRVLVAEALSEPPELGRLRLHLRLLDVDPDRSGPPDPAHPWLEEDPDDAKETSFQGWRFTTVVDPDAEEQRKRQTRFGLVTIGAAVLVGILVGVAGGGDETKPPPGIRCPYVDGAPDCQALFPSPNPNPPLWNWRTAYPSYYPTYVPSLLPVPGISISLRPVPRVSDLVVPLTPAPAR
ncbi:M48 family metalloprotease [Actinacidiphila sp. bgisy160]|uniref:M48 family metalloprotease n=1 Tax=Actinacidiphila sp. bgisy160 TaxID=3413796 RepID=UPI003D75E5E3